MWRGFTDALVTYGVTMCDEWERRGHADAVRRSLLEFGGGSAVGQDELWTRGRLPSWLGRPALHASHRSALVAKLPEHYRPRFPDADPSQPYHWPRPLFPQWPIRRRTAMSRAKALAALRVEDEDSLDDRGRAVFAALRSAGPVVWVHGEAYDGDPPPLAELRPPLVAKKPGKVVASIARPPTPEDVASVRAEVRTPPLLHVYSVRALTARAVQAAMPDPALVVVEHGVDVAAVRRRFGRAELMRVAPEAGV